MKEYRIIESKYLGNPVEFFIEKKTWFGWRSKKIYAQVKGVHVFCGHHDNEGVFDKNQIVDYDGSDSVISLDHARQVIHQFKNGMIDYDEPIEIIHN